MFYHQQNESGQDNSVLGTQNSLHPFDYDSLEGEPEMKSSSPPPLQLQAASPNDSCLPNQEKPHSTKEGDKGDASESPSLEEKAKTGPVVRIGDDDEQYVLYDKWGGIISLIPAGTKVAVLENGSMCKVITWHDGNYREGFLAESAFKGTLTAGNKYAKEVFLNDAKRILEQAAKRNKYSGKMAEVYLQAWQDIELIEHGNLALDENIFVELQRRLDTSYGAETPGGIPAQATNITEDIQSTFSDQNPSSDTKPSLETTLLLPISQDWFGKNGFVEIFMEDFAVAGTIFNPENLDENYFGTGEVIQEADRMEKIIATIMKIKPILENGHPAKDSPEGKWILEQTKSDLTGKSTIVIMESGNWNAKGDEEFSDYVAMDNSFGPVNSSRPMSLALHEMNMGSLLDFQDTHMNPTDCDEALAKGREEGIQGEYFENPEHIDDLFRTDSTLAFLDLVIMLKHIKEISNE